MANTYFVVHNGLTVGNLSVDAETADLTTTGNISARAITVSNLQQTQLSLGIDPAQPVIMAIALGG